MPIRNFYGIELTDFGAETAKLALFIAEYQSNALFKEAFTDELLLLVGNRNPLKAKQNLYFKSKVYRGRFDTNPLH